MNDEGDGDDHEGINNVVKEVRKNGCKLKGKVVVEGRHPNCKSMISALLNR